MKRLALLFFSVAILFSCSKEPVIFTLTTSANPSEGGTVNGGMQYNEGEIATISAIPSAEYEFKNWSGSASGTSPSTTVVMNSDKSVVANFIKKKYPLTLNVEGEGSITEKVIKQGLALTDYNSGTVIELTAIPDEEWIFVEWKGDLTGSENPKQITIDKSKTVTAVFLKKQYPLTIEIEGSGNVVEKVIKAGAATDYNSGTILELTANAQNGWNFIEWQGDLTGTDNPKQITIDKAKTVKAVFQEEEKVAIRLIPSYEGVRSNDELQLRITNSKYDTIASIEWEIYDKWGQGIGWSRTSTQTGVGLNGEWYYEAYKNSDVKVSIKFPQNLAYEFKGWGDNIDSKDLTIEFKAESNILLEPRFEPIKHTIPNDEARLYLASTCRDFGLFGYNEGGICGTNSKDILGGYDRYNDQVPLVNLYDVTRMRFVGPLGKVLKKDYNGMFLEYMKDLRILSLPSSGSNHSNQYIEKFDGSIYPKLKELGIGNIKSIDLSNNIEIEYLGIYESIELTELDISNNTNISDIYLRNISIQNLDLKGFSSLTDVDLIGLDVESLNFEDSDNIIYLDLENLNNLKSIVFAENEATVRMKIYNTNLEDLDLSPNKELKTLHIKDGKLEILDLSNNGDLKDLYASECANLKCVIANQYQLDNLGNYEWYLPQGVEIKLNCD